MQREFTDDIVRMNLAELLCRQLAAIPFAAASFSSLVAKMLQFRGIQ
jgi:hypothetical protein